MGNLKCKRERDFAKVSDHPTFLTVAGLKKITDGHNVAENARRTFTNKPSGAVNGYDAETPRNSRASNALQRIVENLRYNYFGQFEIPNKRNVPRDKRNLPAACT
jgi:hypothetical protein